MTSHIPSHSGDKPRVLVFAQWFTPGHKAGGPIRSIQTFIGLLGHELDIYIYSSDRDLGEQKPFSNIQTNTWIDRDDYTIIYNDPQHQSAGDIKKAIKKVQPDLVYLNSMYSYKYSILPLLILRLTGYSGKIVLAPRGMLIDTAINYKSGKKKPFLFILKNSGLLRNVFFQATDEQEFHDIGKVLKIRPERIVTIDNQPHLIDQLKKIEKRTDLLKLIYVGRIHPLKGLDLFMDTLMKVKSRVDVNVVGLIQDKAYFDKCVEKVKGLPENIKVKINGDKALPEVLQFLEQAHFMVSPTHGENFGHAIFEALSSGRPVIISDRTPWKELGKEKCGWNISLKNLDQFTDAIQVASAMEQEEYDQWCENAFRYAKTHIRESNIKEKYIKLFSLEQVEN